MHARLSNMSLQRMSHTEIINYSLLVLLQLYAVCQNAICPACSHRDKKSLIKLSQTNLTFTKFEITVETPIINASSIIKISLYEVVHVPHNTCRQMQCRMLPIEAPQFTAFVLTSCWASLCQGAVRTHSLDASCYQQWTFSNHIVLLVIAMFGSVFRCKYPTWPSTDRAGK